MYAQKSTIKNYTVIFLLYYAFKCIAIVSAYPTGVGVGLGVHQVVFGYENNWPHNPHFPMAGGDANANWKATREQHPWETRLPPHHHRQTFHNGLAENAPQTRFLQSPWPNTYDTNAVMNPIRPHHPWHVQWPHGRNRFQQRNWPGNHFGPDTDAFNGQDQQMDNNQQMHGNRNFENTAPHNSREYSYEKDQDKGSVIPSIARMIETTTPTTKDIVFPKAYEATVSPTSADFDTTENPFNIDVRGAFV